MNWKFFVPFLILLGPVVSVQTTTTPKPDKRATPTTSTEDTDDEEVCYTRNASRCAQALDEAARAVNNGTPLSVYAQECENIQNTCGTKYTICYSGNIYAILKYCNRGAITDPTTTNSPTTMENTETESMMTASEMPTLETTPLEETEITVTEPITTEATNTDIPTTTTTTPAPIPKCLIKSKQSSSSCKHRVLITDEYNHSELITNIFRIIDCPEKRNNLCHYLNADVSVKDALKYILMECTRAESMALAEELNNVKHAYGCDAMAGARNIQY